MTYLLSGASVFFDGEFAPRDIKLVSANDASEAVVAVSAPEYFVFPGFADVHVHFREPGFSYKETIATGSAAAARGGFTAVCTMPNLSPVPDCLDNLKLQLDIIKRDAGIRIVPFGSITRGEAGRELSDIEALAPFVCGFSDDGRGVDDTALMREAMIRAKAVGRLISAHCEDGTQIKDSPEAEWKEIERDIKLADETGCAFHVCHISTKESVALIRDAKRSGVDITCETAPHYLTLADTECFDHGRFKMNPPVRTALDREALLQGVVDGTIDMIATDHAPHSADEKSRGFAGSLNGVVGLETSFPVLYTELVKKGVIPLARLIELMSVNPSVRFDLENDGFTVFDLSEEYTVDPSEFLTMGRSSPFEGRLVAGRCIATASGGNTVYLDKKFIQKYKSLN